MSTSFKPAGYSSVPPYFFVPQAQRFIELMTALFSAKEAAQNAASGCRAVRCIRRRMIATLLTTGAMISIAEAQTLSWGKLFGGELTYAQARAITVANSGHVIVVGTFYGTVDFDPGPGTYMLDGLGEGSVFVCKLDPSGDLVWAKQLDPTGGGEGLAIAADGLGSIWVTGSFQGTVDLDPGPDTFTSSAVAGDVFLIKLAPNGDLQWAGCIGGSNFDVGHSLAIDGDGNVHVTGTYADMADMDPGPGTSYITPADLVGVFVVKLSAAGELLWAKSIDGIGGSQGHAIAVDAIGNVHVAGSFSMAIDADPGIGVMEFTATGPNNVFISKLDPSGVFIWARHFPGTGTDEPRSIAVDVDGNVITTGLFQETMDLDPGAGSYEVTSAGDDDIFICKLDASGQFAWAIRAGSTHIDRGGSVAVDDAGNIFVIGQFLGTIDIDGGPGVHELTTDLLVSSAFMGQWSAAGQLLWAGQVSAEWNALGNGIALDANGIVHATGYCSGNVDLDPGPASYTVAGIGASDTYVIKLGGHSLGTEDAPAVDRIALFPNPTEGDLRITLGADDRVLSISVRNADGRPAQHVDTSSGGSVVLSIGGAAGLYSVEVRTVKGDRILTKVIKH